MSVCRQVRMGGALAVSWLLTAILASGCQTSPAPPAPIVAGAFPWPGFYSAAHKAAVEDGRFPIEAYIEIDPDGMITAYALKNLAQPTSRGGCLVLAKGGAVNASLQGLKLQPGKAPNGDSDYEVTAGNATFGIAAGSDTGKLHWFVHTHSRNNTVYVQGSENLVITGLSVFSITGPPLKPAEARGIKGRMCRA